MYAGKRRLLSSCSKLTDIPPRVVIDILSYVCCELQYQNDPDDEYKIVIPEKYDLYGYFSKDRLRNICMIFTSIHVNDDFPIEEFCMNFSKLRSLSIIIEYWEFGGEKIAKSPEFHLLETLELNDILENEAGFDEIFAKQEKPKFANLKNLRIDSYNEGTGENWDVEILKKLHSLELSNTPLFGIAFSKENYAMLKKLRLFDQDFEEPMNIDIPSLKHLGINMCSNVTVKNGHDIQYLEISICKPEILREAILKTPKLRTLKVWNIQIDQTAPNNANDWFLDFFENRLEFLERLEIVDFFKFTGTSKNIKLHEMKNLRTMVIRYCPNLEEAFFFSEVKSLRNLKISRQANLEYSQSEKWRVLSNLEKLSIEGCGKVDNKLLEDHDVPNLRNLKVGESTMSGSNWKNKKNLESLRICSCSEFDDSLFTDFENCENLEYLKITGSDKLTGSNWKKRFSKMRKMKISQCPKLVDSVMSENEYPELEELEFSKNDMLKGRGWGKLGKLRKFVVKKCGSFEDEFFERQETLLEYLELEDCDSLKGANWKFMKHLEEFKHNGYDSFIEKVMDKISFPEYCEIVEKVYE